MQERQSILENLRWLAGANIVVKPIWFAFLLLSARLLGPEEFGRYMFAIAYVSIIGVIFEGGIDVLSVRELAIEPTKFPRFFSHTSFFKVLSATVVGIIALAGTFVYDLSSTNRAAIVAAIPYAMFSTLMVHFRFIVRSFEIMKLEAHSILLEKFSVIGCCGIALFLGQGAELFTVSYSFAYLIATVGTFSLVVKHIGWPHWNISRQYLFQHVIKPAMPYALMGFFMIVYFRSGTLMLSWLTGREDLVGYYNAGYRLLEGFILFPSVIMGPIFPSFSRYREDKPRIKNLLIQGGRTISVLSIAISVPIFIFKEDFTALLFGQEYAQASTALGIIVLSMIPVGLTWVFGTLVAAVGRQGKANILIFLVTLLNLSLHYLLIPSMGVVGAAVTTLVTESAMSIACIWIVRDFLDVNEFFTLFAKAFVPALIAYIIKSIDFFPAPFLVELAILMVIMISSFFFLRLVTIADIRRVTGRS